MSIENTKLETNNTKNMFQKIKKQIDLKFFFFPFILAFTINSYSQLSGTYTVGGASPNFPTLDSAFNYMEMNGVSGKVRLNVRSGLYTLRTTISAISGASATKMIQVAPDPTNTSPVIFKNKNTSSANNFLVNIKQGFLRFDSLQFRIDSTSSFGCIFTFSANCNTITINACSFYGRDTNVFSGNFTIIDNSGGTYKVDYLKVLNSSFKNGIKVIYLEGPINNPGVGNEFRFNKIMDYYGGAVLMSWQDRLIVEGNYSKDINKYSDAIGFHFFECSNTVIVGNQIYVSGKNGFGLQVNASSNSASSPVRVFNNFVCGYDSTKSGTYRGIRVALVDYIEFDFNTIVTFNKSSASTAAVIFEVNWYSSETSIFRNNIFYARSGYAIDYGTDITGIKKSDYNLFYSGGNNLAYYNYNAINNLSNLQSSTKLDSHSISKSLVFKGLTDLHTLTFDLYKKGISITGITKDIDGASRKSPKPDIGAEEQRIPSVDLALTSFTNNLCSGNTNVFIGIKNLGLSRIDSGNLMWQISINGGAFTSQTDCHYFGALVSEKDTQIKLGVFNFKIGSNYKFRIWINAVNGKRDSLSSNDTLIVKPIEILYGGILTIGGSSPDFPTIDSAFNTLERKGICGPVRLHLRQGTYVEQTIIGRIPGASNINTIKLISDPKNSYRPRVGYTPTSIFNNWVINFTNASYVSIDSITLFSIAPSNPAYGRVVVFGGINSHLTLNEDSLIGINTKASSSDFTVVCDHITAKYNNSNLSITNCLIKNGSDGIALNGNEPSDKGSGILVKGNRILGFSYRGIVSVIQQNIKISNNYITDNNSNNSPKGIYLEEDDNCEVSNNIIILGGKINPTGIFVNSCIGSLTLPTMILNNSISLYNTLATGGAIGINSNFTSYTRIFFNSVNILGGDTSSCVINFTGPVIGVVRNNNFVNMSPGFIYYVQGSGGIRANYNNLYTKGKYFAYYKSLSKTLKELTKLSSVDTNSLSVNPEYFSSGNLHTRKLELNNKAIYLQNLNKDLDNQTRSLTAPDIGAYEFTPLKNEVDLLELLIDKIPKVCGKDSTELSVVLQNNGIDSIGNFNIYMIVNDSTTIQKYTTYYKKFLYSGKKDTFNLSKFQTTKGGVFYIKVFVSSIDSISFNDTLNAKTIFLQSSPAKMADKVDTICDNQQYYLKIKHPAESFLRWYDSAQGGKQIAEYDSLSVNNVKRDTTFYVSALLQHPAKGSFISSTNNNNASCKGGVMFNLKPKKDLLIDSFTAIFADTGKQKVSVFLKKGTYLGYETDSSKWQFVDLGTASPKGAAGIFYAIKLTKSIRLYKDSLYGIYLNYNAKYQSGNIINSNSDIVLSTGSSLCARFGKNNPNNIFNGQVYYSNVTFCESDRYKYKLKVNKSPVVNLGKDTGYCANFGINILLDAGSGYSKYNWSGGDTTQSKYVKDEGKYSVMVVNYKGCKGSDDIVITKNPVPIMSLGSDINFCTNQSINVILNPGSTVYKYYLWSTGSKVKNIKVTTPGTYSLIVTDDNGCKAMDTIQVAKVNNPVVNLGKDTFYCFREGIKISLDAGSGFAKYRWSTLDTFQQLIVKTKGKYFVEVEDKYACKGSDTLIISEKLSPFVNLGKDTIYCKNNGISTNLNAGSGFKDYIWSTNEKTNAITVKSRGVYSVIITASNGCLANDSIIVTEDAPLVSLGKDTGYCLGKTIDITLDAGLGYQAYQWSTSATSQSIRAQSKGMYTVVITDSLGCKGDDTLIIKEINTNVNLGNDTSYCMNSGFDKMLNAGGGFLSYQWMDGQTTPTIHAKGTGVYSVVVAAEYGCTGTDSLKITGVKNPVINLGADRVLNPYLTVNETLDAGPGFASYLWSNSETSQTIKVTSVGFYSVVASDNKGCEGFDTVQVRLWNPTNITSSMLKGFQIYPNPANDFIIISNDELTLGNIEIYDITGKKMTQLLTEQKQVTINTSDWTNGLYLIRYNINGNSSQFKLVVNHK